MLDRFKEQLTQLYTGTTPGARKFRYALIVFDFVTIAIFIVLAPMPETLAIEILAFTLGLLILADFTARLWIAEDRWSMFKRIYIIADIVVIMALLISPFIQPEIAFLRILRGLRLIHSYHLLNDLRRSSVFFRTHESAFIAAVNLFVFVFFTTSLVFAIFSNKSDGFEAYVDALYFTVTTLTTTGFGDITMTDSIGRLMTVLIMIFGVALFLRLVQTIFRPSKARVSCPDCGLNRHDTDAIHCKHCGRMLNIPTEGAWD